VFTSLVSFDLRFRGFEELGLRFKAGKANC
jgi:hypothetical protein